MRAAALSGLSLDLWGWVSHHSGDIHDLGIGIPGQSDLSRFLIVPSFYFLVEGLACYIQLDTAFMPQKIKQIKLQQ